MMVNKQKRKGTDWETKLVELFNSNIEKAIAKRIPASGALGTQLSEGLLTGDVSAKFPGFSRAFKIEAKTGYGGAKQHLVRKEWLDKIREEANSTFSIPALACKFLGAKEGIKYFIVIDFNTFCDIINYVGDLKKELDLVYEKFSEESLGNV